MKNRKTNKVSKQTETGTPPVNRKRDTRMCDLQNDTEYRRQMKAAESVVRRYSNALRALAG